MDCEEEREASPDRDTIMRPLPSTPSVYAQDENHSSDRRQEELADLLSGGAGCGMVIWVRTGPVGVGFSTLIEGISEDACPGGAASTYARSSASI